MLLGENNVIVVYRLHRLGRLDHKRKSSGWHVRAWSIGLNIPLGKEKDLNGRYHVSHALNKLALWGEGVVQQLIILPPLTL